MFFFFAALSSSFNRLSYLSVFVKHFFLFFYFSFSRNFHCLYEALFFFASLIQLPYIIMLIAVCQHLFSIFFIFYNYSAMRPQKQKPAQVYLLRWFCFCGHTALSRKRAFSRVCGGKLQSSANARCMAESLSPQPCGGKLLQLLIYTVFKYPAACLEAIKPLALAHV